MGFHISPYILRCWLHRLDYFVNMWLFKLLMTKVLYDALFTPRYQAHGRKLVTPLENSVD